MEGPTEFERLRKMSKDEDRRRAAEREKEQAAAAKNQLGIHSNKFIYLLNSFAVQFGGRGCQFSVVTLPFSSRFRAYCRPRYLICFSKEATWAGHSFKT